MSAALGIVLVVVLGLPCVGVFGYFAVTSWMWSEDDYRPMSIFFVILTVVMVALCVDGIVQSVS